MSAETFHLEALGRTHSIRLSKCQKFLAHRHNPKCLFTSPSPCLHGLFSVSLKEPLIRFRNSLKPYDFILIPTLIKPETILYDVLMNTHVFIRVYIAVINTMTNRKVNRKGFISSYSLSFISQKDMKGRNLEARTRSETLEGCCLLACSSLLSLLSCSSQNHQPRVGTDHSEVDPLSSIFYQ